MPTAGPSFEFHRAIQALPHRLAARKRFYERLAELAEFAEGLPGSPATLSRLDEAAESLRQLSGTFA